jgi:hypothetical protein
VRRRRRAIDAGIFVTKFAVLIGSERTIGATLEDIWIIEVLFDILIGRVFKVSPYLIGEDRGDTGNGSIERNVVDGAKSFMKIPRIGGVVALAETVPSAVEE